MMRFFRRLLHLFRRRQADADLRAELEFHRQSLAADLERRGIDATEVAARSRRMLGNETLGREDARDVWRWTHIETAGKDLRFAIRLLTREKAFAVLAIGTLALGIAATTTVVSIVHAEIWRPLPFADSDRLVAISNTIPERPTRLTGFPAGQLAALRSVTTLVDGVAGFRWNESHVVTGGAAVERVRTAPVTANFLPVLGVGLFAGRGFTPQNELRGSDRAVVLTHAFFTRQFPGRVDPPASILLDGQPYDVVGVTPESLRLEFIADPDLFVPIALDQDPDALDVERQVNIVARLKPGVSGTAVQAQLTGMLADAKRLIVVRDLKDAYTGYAWRTFAVYFAGAAALLLIACINVANLLLARGLARRQEFLIRTALGVSRLRLIRQLLIEGLVIAAIAGATGIALASVGVSLFSKLAPAEYLTRSAAITLDIRVVAGAAMLSALTALVFSLVPARFASGDVAGVIGREARLLGGDRRQRRSRSVLVFIEMTVAFLLLVGAGILANSFIRLNRAPLGFDPNGLFTFRLLLKGDRYQAPSQWAASYDELAARLQRLPNVSRVTLASSVPMRGGDWMPIRVPGRRNPFGEADPHVSVHVVQPGYFDVFKIPRLSGRALTDADSEGAPRVVVVNRNFAAHYFGAESPVGATIDLLPGGVPAALRPGPVEIVGVVENTKEVGIDEIPFDLVYIPFRQNPLPGMAVTLLESVPDPRRLDAVRKAVADFDQTLPVYGVTTMTDAVAEATKLACFNLTLVGGFAMLALVLAAIGVYGSTAYDSTRRTSEFGLRIALGARPFQVLGAALGHSIRLAALGLVVGLASALFIARALGDSLYLVRGSHNGVIYQVALADPLTLSLAGAILVVVTLVAAYMPVRKATRVSPVVALRSE